MRTHRLKLLGQPACYHVMCPITQGQPWIGTAEKEYLLPLVHRVAAFAGVELLTFCILADHFHLLVRVPEKAAADTAVEDPVLIARVRWLYGYETATELQQLWERTDPQWESQRTKYLARMHDLSVFVKLLKQRFTSWYNRQHGTQGALWPERYASLLVQDRTAEPNPLKLIAAYIDLNPVRAGLVTDAQEYPFSGYGSARLGMLSSQRGLQDLGGKDTWAEAQAWYDRLLKGSFASLFQFRQPSLSKGWAFGSKMFVLDALRMLANQPKYPRAHPFMDVHGTGDLYVGRNCRS